MGRFGSAPVLMNSHFNSLSIALTFLTYSTSYTLKFLAKKELYMFLEFVSFRDKCILLLRNVSGVDVLSLIFIHMIISN